MAGVKGRSGRKPAAMKHKLLELLADAWTYADRVGIIKALNTAAKAGDVEAAKTLLAYSYGRPSQKHEVSGPEGAPIGVELDVGDILRAKLDNLARARGAK